MNIYAIAYAVAVGEPRGLRDQDFDPPIRSAPTLQDTFNRIVDLDDDDVRSPVFRVLDHATQALPC